MDCFTEREREVLEHVSQGKQNKEIAKELFISVQTVNGHVRSMLKATGFANRTQLAVYGATHKLAMAADHMLNTPPLLESAYANCVITLSAEIEIAKKYMPQSQPEPVA